MEEQQIQTDLSPRSTTFINETTPRSSKRVARSPVTPGKKPKKQRITSKKPWSEAEKKSLYKLVHLAGGPENVNWEYVGSHFIPVRSAKSSQSAFARISAFKEEVTEIDDKGTQTVWPQSHVLLDSSRDGNLTTPAGSTLRQLLEQSPNEPSFSKDHSYCETTDDYHSLLKNVQPDKLTNYMKTQIQLLLSSCTTSEEFICGLLQIENFKKVTVHMLCKDNSETTATLKRRKHDASLLIQKDYDDLLNTNFRTIVNEFCRKFPEILTMILSVMIPKDKWENVGDISDIIPKLAMIYGIMLQASSNELSRMQRLVAVCLTDSVCEQKVFDRLNKLGVSLSYGRMTALKKTLSGRFNQQIIDAVASRKTFRIVGDNLNFSVGVHQEEMNKHKHMVHMFASAAVIIENRFINMEPQPEINCHNLGISDIVLSIDEYKLLRNEVTEFILDVAKSHIPQLCPILNCENNAAEDNDNIGHTAKTTVIPLPVLNYNEQKYSDVVSILDSYENLIEIVKKDGTIQIGGDQLTRERFSGAKNLRIGNHLPQNFNNLEPVTFEFFHLCINYLEKAVLGNLYKDSNTNELGTLKCEIDRLLKNDFNKDVIKAYEADKSVILSVLKAYLAEALMEGYGLEDKADICTDPCPPSINEFIDSYIFPMWSGKEKELEETLDATEECDEKGDRITTVQIRQPDYVKNYAHLVLELGVVFQLLLQILKCPSRRKLLAVFKMIMIILWGKNTKAKYPLEIFRLLVQQYCLLTQQQAFQCLHACFVNTMGKPDTHVPTDLQMEWIVKEQKKHIKHMFNNKTNENIQSTSASLPGISLISENFDKRADVIVRATKHRRKDLFEDECKVLDDLRSIRPFQHKDNRKFKDFKTIKKSSIVSVDWLKFAQWFNRHKDKFQP